jgi:hypothetical protein
MHVIPPSSSHHANCSFFFLPSRTSYVYLLKLETCYYTAAKQQRRREPYLEREARGLVGRHLAMLNYFGQKAVSLALTQNMHMHDRNGIRPTATAISDGKLKT